MRMDTVLLEITEGVAVLTLNRPAKLNAISHEMLPELDAHLDRLAEDTDVRAIVLTGAGSSFSAGRDVSVPVTGRTPLQLQRDYEWTAKHQLKLRRMPQIVVAAVNGYCLGRGMELALWCDLVLAASSARFGQPEVRSGSFVASILPWLTTSQRAKLIMLTGDTVSAQEAYEAGFIVQVIPGEDALPAAKQLARRLAHVPVPTARAIKRYVNDVEELAGLSDAQKHGAAVKAMLVAASPEELGIQELSKIRREGDHKAFIAARNKPFEASAPPVVASPSVKD